MADATGDPFGKPKDEPKTESPQKASGGVLSGLVQSRVERFKGAEAASIGIVLGGCIAAGFFGGLWLDHRLGTNYWMPIGFGFGVVAGFRELFHTIRRLNDKSQREREERKNSRTANADVESVQSGEFRKTKGAPLAPETEEEPVEARLFSVPAPPTASFEKPVSQSVPRVVENRRESLEELTQRLLDEDEGKADNETA